MADILLINKFLPFQEKHQTIWNTETLYCCYVCNLNLKLYAKHIQQLLQCVITDDVIHHMLVKNTKFGSIDSLAKIIPCIAQSSSVNCRMQWLLFSLIWKLYSVLNYKINTVTTHKIKSHIISFNFKYVTDNHKNTTYIVENIVTSHNCCNWWWRFCRLQWIQH